MDDIAEVIIKALEYNEAVRINTGSSNSVQLSDRIKTFAEVTGEVPRIMLHKEERGDVEFAHADILKAGKYLARDRQQNLEKALRTRFCGASKLYLLGSFELR